MGWEIEESYGQRGHTEQDTESVIKTLGLC